MDVTDEATRVLAASDHYAVLGVSASASHAMLRKSFRARSLLLHPDKNVSGEETTAAFAKLLAAWEVLSDAQRRGQYDALRLHTAAGPSRPHHTHRDGETQKPRQTRARDYYSPGMDSRDPTCSMRRQESDLFPAPPAPPRGKRVDEDDHLASCSRGRAERKPSGVTLDESDTDTDTDTGDIDKTVQPQQPASSVQASRLIPPPDAVPPDPPAPTTTEHPPRPPPSAGSAPPSSVTPEEIAVVPPPCPPPAPPAAAVAPPPPPLGGLSKVALVERVEALQATVQVLLAELSATSLELRKEKEQRVEMEERLSGAYNKVSQTLTRLVILVLPYMSVWFSMVMESTPSRGTLIRVESPLTQRDAYGRAKLARAEGMFAGKRDELAFYDTPHAQTAHV